MTASSWWSGEALITRSNTNVLRATWDRLSALPGGKQLFSRLVGRLAPYTGSMGAVVRELGIGYARVSLADRRAVRNHLSCVHAIALANLVELTGNLALAYSLPAESRFIVAGLSLDYVKKARGSITGECTIAPIESNARREYDVSVTLRDSAGDVVVKGVLRTLVGPKRL